MLDGSRLHIERRRQPLRVSPTTPITAVTRIEHRPRAERGGSPDAGTMATVIAETLQLPRVRSLQVDFDATVSERPLYRAIIGALRERLGTAVPLSITALASWCVGDRWIDDLRVDDAIPMLFRMGSVDAPFVRLVEDASAGAPICRGSLGLSLDEPLDLPADGRRRYVFTPRPWTEDDVAVARKWTRR